MATENNNQDQKLQSYELMIIFTPVLAEEEYKAAQQKYADIITAAGGSITSNEAIGLQEPCLPDCQEDYRSLLAYGVSGPNKREPTAGNPDGPRRKHHAPDDYPP